MKKSMLLFLALFLLLGQGYASPCSAITTFPWTESFDHNGTNLPACWTNERITGPIDWAVVTASTGSPNTSHTGTHKARFQHNSNNGHTARLIMPAFDFSGMDLPPVLSFWHAQRAWANDQDELRIYYKTSASGTWTLLAEYTTNVFDWTERILVLPNPSNDYYIAFEAVSNFGHGVHLDAIRIQEMMNIPDFDGPTTLSMGTVFNNLPTFHQATYTVLNKGGAELIIDATTGTSPELSIANAPITIAPTTSQQITVLLNIQGFPVGDWDGILVLETNDPNQPTVSIDVSADIEIAYISSFIEEGFSDHSQGTGFGSLPPQGWQYNRFQRVGTGGINNSPAARANIYATGEVATASVTTSYVHMGTNPEMSFFYRASNFSSPQGPADPNNVSYVVRITDDFGVTWDTIKTMAQGEHISSANFAEVVVNVAAYANKLCQVQIIFNFHLAPEGDIHVWLDDITIGTAAVNELAAISITGSTTPIATMANPYTVTIRNNGSATQTNYTVKLMQEGNVELVTLPGVSIASGETKEFVFNWIPTTADTTYIWGEVVLVGDENPENNQTTNFHVIVKPAGWVPIQVGTGTGLFSHPYDFRWHHTLSQSLYFPNEIRANGGTINGLVYQSNIVTAGGLPNHAIQIWMGETDSENLANDWIDPSTLILVFDGTLNFPHGSHDVVIEFPTPYNYQGGNLVIYSYKTHGAIYATNDLFRGTTFANSNRTRFARVDNPNTLNPAMPSGGSTIHNIPNTTFITNMLGMGGVTGVVTGTDGPIQGVRVQLVGSPLFSTTNSAGTYTFPHLTPGNYELEVDVFGYDAQTIPITIAANATATQNILLLSRETVIVSGRVIGNNAPNGLDTVRITLSGTLNGMPVNFSTTTNATGHYSIADVYSELTYTIEAKSRGYMVYTNTVSVEKTNLTHNITLNEIAFPVIDATAELVSDNVVVTWKAPTGSQTTTVTLTAGDLWGDNTGYQMLLNSTATAFVAWPSQTPPPTDGRIPSIGPLAECGRPADYYDTYFDFRIPQNANPACNTTNIVFRNSSTIQIPSGIYDYAIVNPDPFHSVIWIAGGNHARGNNFVFEPLKHYTFTVERLGEWDFVYLNITDITDLKSGFAPINYSVYRFLEGTPEAEWTLLSDDVTNLTFTDNAWSTLPEGIYQYAIKANYADGIQAMAVRTNTLDKNQQTTIVEVENRQTIEVFPNPVNDELHIQTNEIITQIELLDLNGRVLQIWHGNHRTIHVQAVASGSYILRVHTPKSVVPIRIVKQ